MKQRDAIKEVTTDLATMLTAMEAALNGDSNDDEHDALFEAAETVQDALTRLLPLAGVGVERTGVEVKWGYVDDGGHSDAMWYVDHAPGLDVEAALIAVAREYNATEGTEDPIEDITRVFDLDAALLAKHGLTIPDDDVSDHYIELDEYPDALDLDDGTPDADDFYAAAMRERGITEGE
jgi:hypothetical protein